jgi:phage tail-like protein
MAEETRRLLVQRGDDLVQTVTLDSPVLTIGRTPENSLSLADTLVSRHHAELRMEPEGPTLTDLRSSNGTFVEGIRLPPNQPRLLTNGAQVQIGPFLLTYQVTGGESAAEGGSVNGSIAAAVEIAAVEAPRLHPVQAMQPVQAIPRAPMHLPRPSFPAPVATGMASMYIESLPVIYADNDFLGRFLLLFQNVWEPLEQRQDGIELYFDPRTSPASFLPWLASWLDLSFNQHWPETRRRRLLAEAIDLYRWRGTRYGLVRMIEVCTGITPEITDNPAQPYVFDVKIALPKGGETDKNLIEELIQAHKPAHAGYRLEVT